ncbi:hypothetical protein QBC35DRAFT_513080 [Podospora australis]|uniref:Developmental regulatory protein wetA n=1 Tax=Podospora australis TaxID=1536484 RepID=A0AAN7AJ61_9PEZI|nr:hypothetical protein QBC35DRAFT_513080 [Podospora australis]
MDHRLSRATRTNSFLSVQGCGTARRITVNNTPFFSFYKLTLLLQTWHFGATHKTGFPTMASGVEGGMSFFAAAGGGLPLGGNKETGSFYSHDIDDSGSTEFFDQFVMLDGSDSENTATDGLGGVTAGEAAGGLGQFCGASGFSISPQQLSSIDQCFPSPMGESGASSSSAHGANGGASSNGTHSTATAATAALSRQASMPLLAGSISSQAAARFAQQQPSVQQQSSQTLSSQQNRPNNLHRAASNINEYTIRPDIDISGLPYTASGFTSDAFCGGGGTLSDSELLKLEGLSMRSPRVDLPTSSASVPPSPSTLVNGSSPRKTGRLNNIYAKFKTKAAATFQGKSSKDIKQEPRTPGFSGSIMSTAQMMSSAKMASSPTRSTRPAHLNLSKAPMPLSPPLTSIMPGQTNLNGSGLSTGDFANESNDKFFDQLIRQQQIMATTTVNGTTGGGNMPHTPIQTPNLLDPTWSSLTNSGGPSFLNGTAAGTGRGTNWWDTDLMDTDLTLPASSLYTHPSHSLVSFEYPAPPGTEDSFSGGTNGHNPYLHMPQPRGPSSSVVNLHSSGGHSTSGSSSGDHRTSASARRHKPRAPSSGARHHNGYPPHHPNGLSPRKSRTASGGSSTLSGAAPTPTTPSKRHGHSQSLHRRSASSGSLVDPPHSNSNAIRKRKSWTDRRSSHSSSALHLPLTSGSSGSRSSARRTASCSDLGGAMSVSSNATTLVGGGTDRGAGAGGSGGGGGGGGGGFVNYTPNDRTLLMTGVAPSGSSKTKARREKQAKEEQRLFKEKLARAVEAAGGDLEKLRAVEEGMGFHG